MIRIKNNLPARLPSEYQELDYIESTGTQWIDTGYTPVQNDELEIKNVICVRSSTTNQTLFSAGTGSNQLILIVGKSTGQESAYLKYFTSVTTQITESYNLNNATTIKLNNSGLYYGSAKVGSSSYAGTVNTGLRLLCRANGETPATAQMGEVTIKNGDTLKRNMIPCYRKSDNAVGMYDLVTSTFYGNAGSGTFLMGNEVSKRDLNINPAIFNLPMARGYINGKLFYGEPPRKGRFVCVGESGKSYYSLDGETWASMNGLGSYSFSSVAYGNGKFVCVNSTGSVSASAKASYSSSDGETWVAMTGISNSQKYYGVAYGNGRFVCVGSTNNACYSTNGTSWTSMSNGLSSSGIRYGVAYGNDRFVTVGSGGTSFYSTNGTSWVSMSGLSSSYTYYSVTYGNDRFVTVGSDGYAYYSTNGTKWTKANRLGASYACRGIAYGNGIFVAIGPSGKSYYSTDGITWSDATTFGSGTFYGITYANGIFVVVGNSGYSYYSTDGVNWVAMTGLASATYNGVCYGEI